MGPVTDVVIIGGGPGGYEAALVGSQLGGRVWLVDSDGLGGSAVLTDCVPSKTLIATAEIMTQIEHAEALGLRLTPDAAAVRVDLAAVNRRVLDLAREQSEDIQKQVLNAGVELVVGRGRLDGPNAVVVDRPDGTQTRLGADIILIATGATARELPSARPDGERILNWTQVYNLTELPEKLIVVGSGVTGAEFASAYRALGAEVVLVSSRRLVLPGEDADAALVLQAAFERRGMQIMAQSRAESVERRGDEVVVTLNDGRAITGSHCLMAVGSVPNTTNMGLAGAGVEVSGSGHIEVDKVSRTSVRNIYAAGDCTGVLALASVAAMQGRIAMWHALGDAVAPLDISGVASNVFTAPEIATVGVTQAQVDSGEVRALSYTLPLRGNARAKMQDLREGFVKLFCLPTTGIIIGGVVVSQRASELIHSLSIAVSERITVDNFAHDFTVYPSLSGSFAEAARRLHGHSTEQLDDGFEPIL